MRKSRLLSSRKPISSKRQSVRLCARRKAPASVSRKSLGRDTKPSGAQPRQSGNWRVPRRQKPEPVAAPAGKPALDQFKDYDSYVEAVAEWRAGEAVRAAP